jgi:hypothetical protein
LSASILNRAKSFGPSFGPSNIAHIVLDVYGPTETTGDFASSNMLKLFRYLIIL